MATREYYVYIMTGRCGLFYTGVNNDLVRCVIEHRDGRSKFTARYKLNRLVYFESTPDVRDAIAREKQIKPWRREKKIALIKPMNPQLPDLGEHVLGLPPLPLDARIPHRAATHGGPSIPLALQSG